jgi:phosphatidylinositol alpha-1,6-mannosyltransferase
MTDALMVTSSFLPGRGGIESYLAELCELLAPRVGVLAPAERDGATLPTTLGYETFPWAKRPMLPTSTLAKEVVRVAAGLGTDKVLFGTPWPTVLVGPSLKARGLRYSVIVHGAELLVPAAVPGVRKKLARSLAGADLLFPVSAYTADALRSFLHRRGYEVPPMHLLRARVDLSRFRPDLDTSEPRERLGLGSGERTILCFGRLVPRKGVHRLIDALPAIAEQVPDVALVIAGTGPEERRLRKRAAGRRVIFAGRVPDEDAPALYALADVFGLPVADRWFGLEIEGLGVVLLEAAACGTPCVTGRSGGTPEAVLDGETGFVIDAKDPRALTTAVVKLLNDPTLAAAMGTAGRAHVDKGFSPQNLPNALTNWLNERA